MTRAPEIPSEVRERIDTICDEFELEWQSGRRARIEDYRERIEAPAQSVLLRELLLVEWELIQAQGGSVCLTDYLARFPEYDPAIRAWVAKGAPKEAAQSEARSAVIGRYKLLEKIGEGGFSEVWMVEQRAPVRRRVAMKILKLGMDSRQVVARFEAERQALAMMDHPNIAKIFDAGVAGESDSQDPVIRSQIPLTGPPIEVPSVLVGSGDTPASRTPAYGRTYFIMELVRGVKISEYCDQKQLSTEERLRLFILVCKAIEHAHQKGIIHRDIKPSNVLVAFLDGVPVPKVIDFGIAKATHLELTDKTVFTQFHQFIGSPAYISPEQAGLTSSDVDTRADIYSLGILLYELLVGETPFDTLELTKGGLDQLRQIVREREPLRPSVKLKNSDAGMRATIANRRRVDPVNLYGQLQGDLDWIVMKCLEKDRTRRYATATGLAADLQRYLDHEPVLARPPSAAYKFCKAWERHRVGLTAGLAVGAALVLGSGVSIWQALAARRARDIAILAEASAQVARKEAEQERERANRREAEARQLLYIGNLNRAQEAFEQNNFERTAQLLEETGADPRRGFEWYYWQRQLHREFRTLRGHVGAVAAVAFSSKGRRLATGGQDGAVKVWDISSGEELMSFRGDGAPIYWVAFSPDGERIVSNSGGYRGLRVSHASTGRELLALSWVDGGALSPDGKRIATFSGRRIAIWDAETGGRLLSVLAASPPAKVKQVRFSADGRWIVSAEGGDHGHRQAEVGAVRLWDGVTGEEKIHLTGTGWVDEAVLSSDGQRIATAKSWGGTPALWDVGRPEASIPLQGHVGAIFSLEFSPDGRQVMTGCRDDQTAKIWDALTGIEQGTLRGHLGPVRATAFSPDGHWIATASADGTVKIWDRKATDGGLSLDAPPRSNGFNGAAVSPDGRRIVTADADAGSATVWDGLTGAKLQTFRTGAFAVTSVAIAPDGQRVVTSHWNPPTAKVWSMSTGQELAVLTGHGAPLLRSAVFSPDGQRILTAGHDKTARIWDAASGRELHKLVGHTDGVRGAVFSPDGRRIVTGSLDTTARLWDASSGLELRQFQGHTKRIFSVDFSPDGQRIITGSEDRTARVWDVETGQQLLQLGGHKEWIPSVRFSPNGSRILTTAGDGTVRVWESGSGKELLALKGHGKAVTSAVFFPDNQRILTSGSDGLARVWESATPQQVVVWEEEKKAESRIETRHREQIAREQRQSQEQALALQREEVLRANDPGAIKQWLVLAPIPFSSLDAEAAREQEQIPSEANLRPHEGDRVPLATGERSWIAVKSENYRLDLNRVVGRPTTNSVAYAVTYILSDQARSGLVLKTGSDDVARVYLNQNELPQRSVVVSWTPPIAVALASLVNQGNGIWIADEDRLPGVALKAGLNVLVFKVVNSVGRWEGSVWITDASGQPVPGIRTTLDPDAAE